MTLESLNQIHPSTEPFRAFKKGSISVKSSLYPTSRQGHCGAAHVNKWSVKRAFSAFKKGSISVECSSYPTTRQSTCGFVHVNEWSAKGSFLYRERQWRVELRRRECDLYKRYVTPSRLSLSTNILTPASTYHITHFTTSCQQL
jgi:hypothetical protein